MYNNVIAELDKGDVKGLPEVVITEPKTKTFNLTPNLITKNSSNFFFSCMHLRVASRQSQLQTHPPQSKIYDLLVVVMDI